MTAEQYERPDAAEIEAALATCRGPAPWGVECPCCYRRVVTTEAPCECGFRFPRGYGEKKAASDA